MSVVPENIFFFVKSDVTRMQPDEEKPRNSRGNVKEEEKEVNKNSLLILPRCHLSSDSVFADR